MDLVSNPYVALAVGNLLFWTLGIVVFSRRNKAKLTFLATERTKRVGMTFRGNPLGEYTLQGTIHAIEMTLQNGVQRARPGSRERDAKPIVCAVELPLEVTDLVVCRNEDVERTMGPLPSAPRLSTGNSDFDLAYSVFVSPNATEFDSHQGYRQQPQIRTFAWSQGAILDRLRELKLIWMRTRSGHCELAFEPFWVEDALRAAVTTANLLRATTSQPLLEVPSGTRRTQEKPTSALRIFHITVVLAFFGCLTLALPLSAVLKLHKVDSAFAWGCAAWFVGCLFATRSTLNEAALVRATKVLEQRSS